MPISVCYILLVKCSFVIICSGLLKKDLLMCVGILPKCLSVYNLHAWCLRRTEETVGSPGTGITALLQVLGKWKSSPLQWLVLPSLCCSVPSRIFCNFNLVSTNCLCVYSSWNALVSLVIKKEVLLDIPMLVSSVLLYTFLAFIMEDERSDVNLKC